MQKSLTNILGGFAVIASLTGCATRYNTNISNDLKARTFSDKDFDVSAKQVNIPGLGSYVFGSIERMPESYDAMVYDMSGKLIDSKTLAPMWSLKTNELIEKVSPHDKYSTYVRPDGAVRVYRLNNTIDHLITPRGFEAPKTDLSQRVQSIGESHFTIPEINFGIPEWGDAPYVNTRDSVSGEEELMLLKGDHATFGLDRRTGLIQYEGEFFDEELATIVYVPKLQPQLIGPPIATPTEADLLRAEKILKQVK